MYCVVIVHKSGLYTPPVNVGVSLVKVAIQRSTVLSLYTSSISDRALAFNFPALCLAPLAIRYHNVSVSWVEMFGWLIARERMIKKWLLSIVFLLFRKARFSICKECFDASLGNHITLRSFNSIEPGIKNWIERNLMKENFLKNYNVECEDIIKIYHITIETNIS